MANDNSNNSIFGDIGDDEEFRKRYGEQIGCGIMTAVIYAHDGIAA